MKFLDKLKLSFRIGVLAVALLLLIFSILGVYFYNIQKDRIIADVDTRMNEQLQDLVNIMQSQIDANQQKVNLSLGVAHHILYGKGDISIDDSLKVVLSAINQETKRAHEVEVNRWYLEGKSIHGSFDLVDKIKSMTVETATIFQRIPDGFLRISTNVMKQDGSRAVGTYIPNTSPVIQTVLQGKTYFGRAFVVNDYYLTAYEPIYINGEIQGILYVGVKEKDYTALKEIFNKKVYYSRGYPFIINKEGDFVIHPTLEGSNVSNSTFFKQIVAAGGHGKSRYLWPEDDSGEWKWQYFTYFEPFDSYICVSLYEDEIFKQLNEVKISILLGFIISAILFIIGIYLIMRPVSGFINRIQRIISNMSKGKIVDKIEVERKDELGSIVTSLNTLIEGINNTTQFSKEIGSGNLESEFVPMSDEDVLGNSLLDMRNNLQLAKDEEEKRKKEDMERSWATTGLAKFGDLLRENNDNIDEFAYNIISNLVKYMDANQGGIFFINDENKDDVHIELKGAYAFDRKKFMEKRIEWGEGLVGQSILESETIFMTDIPDEYINITSGLGDANPSSLLIVPLKLNDEVYGAIELAAFKPFEKFQIEFVEKIGESIASTLSSVKVNIRTAQLLHQSQQQAEEMKAQEEEMRQNMEELTATQEQMRIKESELESVLGAVDNSIGTFEMDLSGTITKANENFRSFIQREKNEVIGQKHNTFLDKEEFKLANYNQMIEGLSNGVPFDQQSKYSTPTGSIWLYESFTPIQDASGSYSKALALVIDINESKVLEISLKQQSEELQAQEEEMRQNLEELEATQEEVGRQQKLAEENEEKVRGILNGTQDGIFTLVDGKIETVNQAVMDLCGYTEEELTGQEYKIIFKFLKEEKIRFGDNMRQKALRKDGSKFMAEVIVNKLNHENTLLFFFRNIDNVVKQEQELVLTLENSQKLVEEMKHKEAELKQQNEEMQAQEEEMRQNMEELVATQEAMHAKESELEAVIGAINHSMGRVELDKEGNITDVNDLFEKHIRLSKEELIGKNHKDIIDPDVYDEEKFEALWNNVLSGKPSDCQTKYLNDEEHIWGLESFTPVSDQLGETTSVLLLVMDISEAKNAENELNRNARKLKKMNIEMNEFKEAMTEETKAQTDMLQAKIAQKEKELEEALKQIEKLKKK